MFSQLESARMRYLGIAVLLAGALAATGCTKDEREIGGAVAFMAVTAPLWGPVMLVRSLGPDNPSPTIVSSSPGVVVEVKPVGLPGELYDGSDGIFSPDAIYAAGPGQFMLLYFPSGRPGTRVAAILEAGDATIRAARTLPGDFTTPLGVREGSLFAVSRDRSRLMVLDEGSTSIRAAPLPALGCRTYLPSPHLRFGACVTRTVVTAVNFDTRQVVAQVEKRSNAGLGDMVTVSDDGHLTVDNGSGALLRSPAIQDSVAVHVPHNSRLTAVTGSGSRQLAFAAYGPPSPPSTSSKKNRVAIIDLQSGATLADVPHEGYVRSAIANEAGRIAITGGEETMVVATDQSGTELTRVSMGGGFSNVPKWAELAAWDDRGEWLLLMRRNGKGYLLRFKPLGSVTATAPKS